MLAASENHDQINQFNKTPLKVAIFGFSPSAIKSLEIAFKNYGENCAAIVEENIAEAAIFDFDASECRRTWKKFNANHPEIPTIMVSSEELSLKDAYTISKPLRVGKFIKIFQEIQKTLLDAPNKGYPKRATPPSNETPVKHLENVGNKSQEIPSQTINGNKDNFSEKDALKSHAIGNRENNVNHRANIKTHKDAKEHVVLSKNPNVYYSPKKYFQGIVHSAYREAAEKNIVIELAVKVDSEWQCITFFPGLKKVAVELTEQQLKYICRTPLFCVETKIFRHNEPESSKLEANRKEDDQLVRLESFLWVVALWTSEGRLPKGIDLNAHYRIRRWPNFTRLPIVPNAFSMAALLSQKPINIHMFLKVLNISPGHVYSFFSCVFAIGLLEATSGSDKTALSHHGAAQSHPKRSLFELIVRKLKKTL